MSLIHSLYDPSSDFDRLFDDAFLTRFNWRPFTTSGTASETGRDIFRPKMDLHEDPDGTHVTASFELPGIKPDDVHVDVDQDKLIVSGESASAGQRDERGWKVRERSWGKFSRTLMLPQGTKPTDVHAKMEHGLLNVSFPKAQAPPEPQRITIK